MRKSAEVQLPHQRIFRLAFEKGVGDGLPPSAGRGASEEGCR